MRVHADPTPLVCAALRTCFALDEAVELFGGVVWVAAEEPPTEPEWLLLSDPPLITVHDDGGPTRWPVLRRPTIRVTARAHGLPLAKRVAAYADGWLHTHVPVGLAAISRNGAGFVTARDSDTGADLASFTVTAVVATVETV